MEQEFHTGDIAHAEYRKNVFFEVKVLAVKVAYGKIRYEVKVVKGQGEFTTEQLYKIKHD